MTTQTNISDMLDQLCEEHIDLINRNEAALGAAYEFLDTIEDWDHRDRVERALAARPSVPHRSTEALRGLVDDAVLAFGAQTVAQAVRTCGDLTSVAARLEEMLGSGVL